MRRALRRLGLTLLLLCLSAPAVAFPTVAATNSGFGNGTTNIAISLPAGVAAGDLLIAIFSTGSPSTQTWVAGWTELYDVNAGGSLAGTVAYRIATGTDTCTVTASVNVDYSYITLRITGAHASAAPEKAAAETTDNDANPNPPSITASWGAEDNLFIAVLHDDITNCSAAPTNYTNLLVANNNEQPVTAIGRRELASATDDPGIFTVGSELWISQTLVVRPAAGGEPPATGPRLMLLGVGDAD